MTFNNNELGASHASAFDQDGQTYAPQGGIEKATAPIVDTLRTITASLCYAG